VLSYLGMFNVLTKKASDLFTGIGDKMIDDEN